MSSISSSKLVENTFTKTIRHSECDVTIILRRRPDSERYIVCVPAYKTTDRPLFVSVEQFIRIIECIETWIRAKCTCTNTDNPCIISTSGADVSGLNRIAVTFSLGDNIERINVRNYWKPTMNGAFLWTCIGFSVSCLLYTSPS